MHPHESLFGLLALLHGASRQEVRTLRVADVDFGSRSIRLGARPHPAPLDPATWTALERCLDHQSGMRTTNPHLIVTRGSRTGNNPASSEYLSHLLAARGTTARQIRCTRLSELANDIDPKLVAAAFGMRPEAVLKYLGDRVDDTRLANMQQFSSKISDAKVLWIVVVACICRPSK